MESANSKDSVTIFQCEDSTQGILTAVYDAWASRRGHSHVKLQVLREDTLELFADYVTVQTDPEKAEKVRRTVIEKISSRAWEMVYRATLSEQEGKADDIYRFIVGGLHFGARVVDMLAEPVVMRMMEMNRAVGNEAHFYREFIKFKGGRRGILYSKLRPKNHVLFSVMYHFSDRFSGENFLLLDVGRNLAGIHPAGGRWYLTPMTEDQLDLLNTGTEDEYADLFRTFFRTIAIEERINPKLQRNMFPLRYREFTIEWE